MRVTHLNGLKALEVTLRAGSFRAAADELGVTTAAVGQQIRTLEDFLGCKLFFRTSSGAQPTDHARRIEGKLTASFSSIEDVINQLKYRQPKNRLAVTLPSSFAENWFAIRLPDFYRLNSEIDLRLDASNRMVDLIIEDFDFKTLILRFDIASRHPKSMTKSNSLAILCFLSVLQNLPNNINCINCHISRSR
jgi:LysR family glycine cleavage system transcriptional activator